MAKKTSSEQMQSSFRLFLYYVWTKILMLPKPTRLQYDIALFLETGNAKRFIQAFRGIGKSFIAATYVVWRLWKNPDIKVLVVSANEKFATEIATFIKMLIEGIPELEHLKPRDDQRDSVLAFDVGPAKIDKSPSVKAVGITGQMTGSRGDIILFDDVEVPKNSETETMREKLETQTQEAAAIKKQNAEVIYLGTPQSAESIYGHLEGKGYEVRIWPARYPSEKAQVNYGGNLAPILVADMEADPELTAAIYGTDSGGAPTDPERFDQVDLLDREAEYARSGFMLQFMLDTRLADADRYPLRLRDLIVMDVDRSMAPVKVTWASGPQQVIQSPTLPNVGFDGDRLHAPMYVSGDHVDFTGSEMTIDPSGRGKDETAYSVTKMLNGVIRLRRVGGLKGGYDDQTLRAIAEIAKDEKVNVIRVEENFGDGMFTALLKPVLTEVYPVTVEEYKVTGQKEARIIDILEPVLNSHRLVVDKAALEADLREPENKYRFQFQLSHITKDRGSLKHDDRLDCVASSVGYWTKQLAVNTAKAEDAHKEKLRDKDLEDFIAAARQSGPVRRFKNYMGLSRR